MEASFATLVTLQQHALVPDAERRDVLIHALWIFKADQSDFSPENLQGPWGEAYIAAHYTPAVVLPVDAMGSFIDVPTNCQTATHEAWDELYALGSRLRRSQDELHWLEDELAACDEGTRAGIAAKLALRGAHLEGLAAPGAKIDQCIQGLQDFFNDLSAFQDYKDQLVRDFTRALEDGFDLVDTGCIIPDVPDLADDETEDMREELIVLNHHLSYYLTFKEYLYTLVQDDCNALALQIMALESVPAANAVEYAILAAVNTLYTFKSDPPGAESLASFDARWELMYQAAAGATPGVEPVPAGITVPAVPAICPPDTHAVRNQLLDYIIALEARLTHLGWLNV